VCFHNTSKARRSSLFYLRFPKPDYFELLVPASRPLRKNALVHNARQKELAMREAVVRLVSSVIMLAALSTLALAGGPDPQPPTPKIPIQYPPSLAAAR